ncbi:hypothetical protein FMM68_00505 [Lachnospiraceae bacterium MD329]|nr:hypothetical protein [Lachnospiraceae bacterium MD329]
MEHRTGKIIVSSAGGTAAKGAKTYKVSIPSLWIKEMGLDETKRNVELMFDGNSIYITAEKSFEEFVSQKKDMGHDIKKLSFYDNKELCSVICADFTDKTLKAQNRTDDIVKTAFGNNKLPMWEDFMNFLQERCIPKERSGIREYLEAIGVAEYNPIEIIKKTKGKMAEDKQWIEIEEI